MFKDNKNPDPSKVEYDNKLPIQFSFKSPVRDFTFLLTLQNKY